MNRKRIIQIAAPIICVASATVVVQTARKNNKKEKPATLQSSAPAPVKSLFTATPFTNEQGQTVEGLQAAVQGKKNRLESSEEMPALITVDELHGEFILSNGAVSRVLSFEGEGKAGLYTKSYRNEYIEKELTGEEILPEALIGLYDRPYREIYREETILSLPEYFTVGGNQTENSFVLDSWKVYDSCEKPFSWKPDARFGDPAAASWPPEGCRLELLFRAPDAFPQAYRGLKIKLIYEIYDKLACIKKRVEITNSGTATVTVGRLATELLGSSENMRLLMMPETGYTAGNESTIPFNTPLPCACAKQPDGDRMRALAGSVHSCYEIGPAYQLDGGKNMTFASFDTYELVYSTYWFEQRGLERLSMYRKLFPWITDNPLTFHSTKKLTKKLIDHVAEGGFEMIIQSFNVQDKSENMLSGDQKVLDYYKELIDYAHTKGVGIGIYQAQYQLEQYKSSAEYSANGKGTWGTWCLASGGFDDYYDKFLNFVSYTGVDCVEIDGPYPNCVCDNGEKHLGTENAKHAVHYGYYDSQVKQWENATRLLCASLKNLGVYIQVPAWFYLNGGNKCGIGYEEIAFSEPRQEQLIYGRQIMHNASYARSMSMSWTHVPFNNYHGGGKAAAFYPYRKNAEDYNWVMAEYLGNGITGVFRGDRAYDKKTLPILQKWTSFYKEHRAIINGDIVHISQAVCAENNRSRTKGFDALFHVNPQNDEKGLLWVYNQSDAVLTGAITVPMYYTGLTNLSYPQLPLPGSMGKDVYRYGEYPPNYSWLPKEVDYKLPEPDGSSVGSALVLDENGKKQLYSIDSNANIHIELTLEPMSFTYFIIK